MNENAGHRKRMLDRYVNEGIESFSEHEIMEVMLYLCIPYKDTNDIAHRLTNTFGSLSEVLDASYDELIKVEGVGESTAAMLHFLRDSYFWYSYSRHRFPTGLFIDECYRYAKSQLMVSRYEHMLVLMFDPQGRMLGEALFGTEEIGSIYVNSKEIVEECIKVNARSIVLFHNHLSNDNRASNADVQYTAGLFSSLRAVDITILDHIITTQTDKYYSFRENGLIKKFIEKYND